MAAFLHHEAEMSKTKALPAADVSAAPAASAASSLMSGADLATHLGGLRAEIDWLDDALHDLLMRRAGVVERVAELSRIGKIPFRPGREAAIIRRLLARHAGRLPPRAISRLWREMFAANIAIEARFLVAVCESGPGGEMVQLAREHFGALTPLRVAGSTAEAIAEVSAGRAMTAVLPLPLEGEREPWWPTLSHQGQPRLHVVARLPYWAAPRPEGAVTTAALVVAAAAPDASGMDRSLIGFELPARASQGDATELLASAGLAGSGLLLHDTASGPDLALAELEGFIEGDDPRLGRLSGVWVLGSYAVPIGAA